MKNIIINFLQVIGFGVGLISGIFIGNLIRQISLLPPAIDKDSIIFCSAALLANTITSFFQGFATNNKISSIIIIILNILLALTFLIIFGFNALFSVCLIIGVFIFANIEHINKK